MSTGLRVQIIIALQGTREEESDDEKKAGRGGKGGVMKGFSIQNLLEMCVKFGYQNWTVLDVENMIRAYELSEAKGEIIRAVNQHHLDSKQSKEDKVATN